ncbi:unnamed protein product [Moneuplotes crassus]|uniref:Uncharacterized protein n=1 Tax=Euplotes crassus TaxID=5936 RepID=A0AAD2D0E2_EUPCR|nr:unnamed protein product [Moneuplotes crassus]
MERVSKKINFKSRIAEDKLSKKFYNTGYNKDEKWLDTQIWNQKKIKKVQAKFKRTGGFEFKKVMNQLNKYFSKRVNVKVEHIHKNAEDCKVEKRIKSPLPPALLNKFTKRKRRNRNLNNTIRSEGFYGSEDISESMISRSGINDESNKDIVGFTRNTKRNFFKHNFPPLSNISYYCNQKFDMERYFSPQPRSRPPLVSKLSAWEA